jgi:hypothetical protein
VHGCSNVDQICKACWVDKNAPVLDQQFLYNVYVHPAPDFAGVHLLRARSRRCFFTAMRDKACAFSQEQLIADGPDGCHRLPDAGPPNGSVFEGHEIPDRVKVRKLPPDGLSTSGRAWCIQYAALVLDHRTIIWGYAGVHVFAAGASQVAYFWVQTDWASASLTTATRNLLRHALRDPHAQQFLMLSDTGVRDQKT